jgi:hypothetical protein
LGSVVQPTAHAPAAHGFGKQLSGTWAGHVGAAPVQVDLCKSVTPSAWHTAAAHVVPLSSAKLQTPLAGLHTPAAWQACGAAHTTGAPATHVPPALHWSFCVHKLLSALHGVLAAMGEHVPWLPPTLHAMQSVVEPPPQVVLQQKPSTQMFVEHSWQPPVLQSPPAAPEARLHVPLTFQGTQVPVLSQ